ncbi:MAG: amino acid decarboxylase [Paenibacillaceae bacterium]|jgi:hypothetical protein|nr:amino acid decarboxylase [Paenibacillaceae bacterium]
MLQVEKAGNVAKLDVREKVLRGEHPKNEIFDFVRQAAAGTIIEIHMPHKAQPIVAGLQSMGINAIVSELGPQHYRIMCIKL